MATATGERERDGDERRRARTLKRLWEHITKDAIVELKSVSRPYRSRNLDRLLAYLHLYFADQAARLKQRSHLVGVLVAPTRTCRLLPRLCVANGNGRKQRRFTPMGASPGQAHRFFARRALFCAFLSRSAASRTSCSACSLTFIAAS